LGAGHVAPIVIKLRKIVFFFLLPPSVHCASSLCHTPQPQILQEQERAFALLIYLGKQNAMCLSILANKR
jgi:hypothetical protein